MLWLAFYFSCLHWQIGMHNDDNANQRILIGITGASGATIADKLVLELMGKVSRIYVVFTDSAKLVVRHELSSDAILCRALSKKLTEGESNIMRVFSNNDLFAPCASGTSAPHAMVVVPCSMGTLSRIASGTSSNLLERSADVIMKQRRPLLVCPRETPLNLIHLRNMVSLTEAGAQMIPLMPGFYQKPETIDDLVNFCVGKILEQLNVQHALYEPWNKNQL
jgi:flavin prenyltransferase